MASYMRRRQIAQPGEHPACELVTRRIDQPRPCSSRAFSSRPRSTGSWPDRTAPRRASHRARGLLQLGLRLGHHLVGPRASRPGQDQVPRRRLRVERHGLLETGAPAHARPVQDGRRRAAVARASSRLRPERLQPRRPGADTTEGARQRSHRGIVAKQSQNRVLPLVFAANLAAMRALLAVSLAKGDFQAVLPPLQGLPRHAWRFVAGETLPDAIRAARARTPRGCAPRSTCWAKTSTPARTPAGPPPSARMLDTIRPKGSTATSRSS